ncbi:FCD domain-containing protein [Mesobaculum littorinae]|uniref:FCD domain-containing protein n=1 Tax=Mesobaculum littorinae TaxID=2486419 RepID=UPI0019D47382|nr:FCD domain-containing protein [Mesobaculum littorinae]
MYRVTTRAVAPHHAAFATAVEARDVPAMIASNREFHAAIAEAGSTACYANLIRGLLDEKRRILRLYWRSYDDDLPRRYVTEHEGFLVAITARDVAGVAGWPARMPTGSCVRSGPSSTPRVAAIRTSTCPGSLYFVCRPGAGRQLRSPQWPAAGCRCARTAKDPT